MHKELLNLQLQQLQHKLEQCTKCPTMFGPPVHGLPVTSKVMLIGQAPGFKEIELLKPELIILVGKLAISQFMTIKKLDEVIGKTHPLSFNGHSFDVIPLPHPSGASTWPLKEPGTTLLQQAMKKIKQHPSWKHLNCRID
ncbi:MAG: hypothetical protein KZQ64_15020 [gamma proteobacterium symbiont of Bathyaustriella thionipta]|nr:hypothetical protein [gamma proteobacterium symbiont of Bathyaustriella thionipta]MCU7949365.1 hypothetical protein [gamma proteobacterium symbiont of Bathyaustriella thionipta]MCU7954680.1 hypothetical protein [gamma proteobacterium symbiont of Bathyaustriella thionipta]MCU7955964.1 hypothetical protein [gamma proteobacterium symbiont of Bathyaustriella thionipta]MCU7968178.1 hypothetical protein [gamma proteobacterium symbiont of Bathyaustriella thionipta]